MNIDTARKTIQLEFNKPHRFLYRGNRNQNEIFDGKITKIYSSVFLIETPEGIRSFSLNDFIIDCIKIIS